MLEEAVARDADRELLRTPHDSYTVKELAERVASRAGQLMGDGVERGDRLVLLSDEAATTVELWLACAWLGAVLVPANTALRGPALEHVLRDSGAIGLVVDPELEERLDRVVVPEGLAHRWATRDGGRLQKLPPPGVEIVACSAGPGETAALLYTSGTTGPAKGVLCPHAQWYWWAVTTGRVLGVGAGDVLHTSLPLFHTNALNAFCQALVHDATLVAGERFSASRFWSRLRSAGATVTYLLGPMVSILLRTAPGADDARHGVRVALAPATTAEAYAPFRERFGVELIDAWGSTETSCVLSNVPGDIVPGTMGRALAEFQARVVDENDDEVPDGAAGELVVRSNVPFAFATGYHGRAEQTVSAWRNLWLHTGDRVVRDGDGRFRFLDRMGDVIRRRGENISSFEVERVLHEHPLVAAAAVVPVPSKLGEDDVLAYVVARDDGVLDPVDLIRFCEPRLAYFAVPRYVEFVDELPVTPTGRVEKYRLRERGLTQSAWDREAAGVEVQR
ncbi:MAG: AMP-binding protein [Pyrinomonadaceae bacterium]|nr:AMP-binding protein [Pyrinomonadaceae bacterium]